MYSEYLCERICKKYNFNKFVGLTGRPQNLCTEKFANLFVKKCCAHCTYTFKTFQWIDEKKKTKMENTFSKYVMYVIALKWYFQ